MRKIIWILFEIGGIINGLFQGWTRKSVINTVKRQFPNENIDTIMNKLDRYIENDDMVVLKIGNDIGRARIQLAILKIVKEDIDKIDEYVEKALIDYRDILHWANYA